jgi:hypothetical protein
MAYRFLGVSSEPFRALFNADDVSLAQRGIRRLVADKKPGFPCRISLEDAQLGERLLLLAYEHQPAAHSPYRASGPIFIRAAAKRAYDGSAWPPVLDGRLLSLRAYDEVDMMVDADVAEGDEAKAALARLLARTDTAYVHIHNAKRGCFSCKVVRAD